MVRLTAASLAVLLVLTACDGGGDPVQQALRETATVNQSAVVKYDAGGDATVAPAAAPSPAEAAYIDLITRENRETIAKARTVLATSQDPGVRRSAQAVIDHRTRETLVLERSSGAAGATE